MNVVAPGVVDTAAIRALKHFESARENAEKTTPVPRLGTVEDIADAVAFLVSECASYVTGEVLLITSNPEAVGDYRLFDKLGIRPMERAVYQLAQRLPS